MNESVGFYLHISNLYNYRATYILLKQAQLQLEKFTFKQQQAQATKYCELQANCPVQSAYQLSCFLLMLLTESFYIYFC